MRDCSVTWSSSLYHIGPGFKVYSSFLGEFPTSHRDTVDDGPRFSSPNGLSVGEDHPNIRRHAMNMHPGS